MNIEIETVSKIVINKVDGVYELDIYDDKDLAVRLFNVDQNVLDIVSALEQVGVEVVVND